MQTKVLVRHLCKKILMLSMSISEETETDVYAKYFPHVNEFDVEIFPKGFNNDHSDYTTYEIDLTGEHAELKLREIEDNLKEIWKYQRC